MKKRFQANQRIFSGLGFRFAIVFLLCSVTIAQPQLEPNPNTGVIQVFPTESYSNSVLFDNWGTIDNWGNIINESTFNNFITGSIKNYDSGLLLCESGGHINNEGLIDNEGEFNLFGNITYNEGGTIDNKGFIDIELADLYNWMGTINNYGTCKIHDHGIENNYSGAIYNSSSGTIEILTQGHFVNYDGTIQNDGNIQRRGWITNKDYFHNSGTIEMEYSLGDFSNSGTFENDGTIHNMGIIWNSGTIWNRDSGTILNQFPKPDFAASIFNDGTIINDGIIDTTVATNFHNQGTLKGTGTFIGDLINDSGTVAPGNSPGTMTVDGDFILDGSGILDIEIGGFTPGSFDILDITGTAYMPGGSINFSFLDGYDIITDIGPLESKELTFLQTGVGIDSFASTIIYDFLSIPYFQFDVFQKDNGLIFEATNLVPLPSAVILVSIGLSFSGWLLNKRRMQ